MKPAKFYKYFRINQNLYNSIINGELFFSNPRTFNDPFDSYPRLKTTEEKELARNLFELLNKYVNCEKDIITEFENFEQLNRTYQKILEIWDYNMSFGLYNKHKVDFRDKFVEIYTFYNFPNIFDKLWDINFLALQDKMFSDFLFLIIDYKNYGIVCGSIIPDCPVMWGHYADNHKGVCFEFQLLDENGDDTFCYSKEDSFEIGLVEYTNNPIDILNMSLTEVAKIDLKLLTTKSDRWKYESEIRLIRSKQGFLKFNRKNISAIIFGSRTTPRERYSVCKLLVCLGYKCPFLLAKMQPDIYEMKIDQMILNDVAGGGFHWEELNFNPKKEN